MGKSEAIAPILTNYLLTLLLGDINPMFLQIHNLNKHFPTKNGMLVVLKRALASEPKVLLMDEPFGALDIHTKESMHEFMLDLWQRTGITIFMIAHDVEEAVFLSNRIFALGARPGTVCKVLTVNLPNRTHTVKRHSTFHDYRDELMELLRKHGQEALAVA